MNSKVILQPKVSISDCEWKWKTHDVFSSTNRKRELNDICIKSIRISNENITLSQLLIPTSRAVTQENENDCIHISFQDLNLTDVDDVNRQKLTQEYIERLLKTGIYLNAYHYTFYGHSNSQLQSRSCYLRKENKAQDNFKKISSFGDFSQINSVSKRAKRVGLLFTSANLIINLDQTKCKIIADVERNDLIFTDGCGCINNSIAKEIAKQMKISHQITEQEIDYPSVYQIRYMGYKGVLLVTPDTEIIRIDQMNTASWKFLVRKIFNVFKPQVESTPSILFRKSMKKFENCADTKSFLVVDYAKPFTYGKLNEELIILLSTLKVSLQVFVDRLKDHLELIENCTTNIEAARKLAVLKNIRLDRYADMNQRLITKMHELQNAERSSFFDPEDKSKVKVHIPIKESRLLFGVCDFSEKLLEGQCFVRYSEWSGQMKIYKKTLTGKIVVGRNPCLHPGDIRIFEAVDERDVPELKELCDCIVFSVHGDKPAPSLMSGGDLDGDRFFVCWDKELIPSQMVEPIDYSKLEPTLKSVNFNRHDNDQLIEYFSRYNNFSLGQLKNLYLYWVRRSQNMAASVECIKINELFSKCVDGERVEIPIALRKPHTGVVPPTLNTPFIMDTLEGIIKEVFNTPNQTETTNEEQRQDELTIDDKKKATTPLYHFCAIVLIFCAIVFICAFVFAFRTDSILIFSMLLICKRLDNRNSRKLRKWWKIILAKIKFAYRKIFIKWQPYKYQRRR